MKSQVWSVKFLSGHDITPPTAGIYLKSNGVLDVFGLFSNGVLDKIV